MPKKTKAEKIIRAYLIGNVVISNTQEAITLYEKSRFGELREGKIYYAGVEALYLVETGKMHVFDGKKKLSFEKLLSVLAENDKRLRTKYIVFRDLRQRGYIVKTALKFGADFRVYARGKKPGQEHARWILYAVHESEEFSWHEFAAKSRVAHSTKKSLLLGIVDEENDVTYYEVKWLKP